VLPSSSSVVSCIPGYQTQLTQVSLLLAERCFSATDQRRAIGLLQHTADQEHADVVEHRVEIQAEDQNVQVRVGIEQIFFTAHNKNIPALTYNTIEDTTARLAPKSVIHFDFSKLLYPAECWAASPPSCKTL
jgi:hypothetical protein